MRGDAATSRASCRHSAWNGIGVLVAILLPFVVGVLGMVSAGRAEASEPLPVSTRPEPAPVSGLVVNLNVADAVQLSLVPGLTPARVRAILEWRKHRSFQAPADLLKVRGIGLATFAKAKPWVAVDGPAVRGVSRPARPEDASAPTGH